MSSNQTFKLRLDVDLTPSARVYHLWGYPKAGAPDVVVYLRTIIPAMVAYVLRPTWRAEIGSGGVLYSPTAMWTDADEDSLILRILRASGAMVDLSGAQGNPEMRHMIAHLRWREAGKHQKYLFGWSESGGVWVLGLPEWAEYDWLDWPRPQTGAIMRHYGGSLDCSPLESPESMEEFCSALKERGAHYYDTADVSDEVKEYGLLKLREEITLQV